MTQPGTTKSRRRWIVWAAVFAVVALAGVRVATVIRSAQSPGPTGAFGARADGGTAVSVRVEPARIGNVDERVVLHGNLEPQYEIDVVALRSGRLAQVNVEVGDRVEPGDVLAVVEHSELLVQLRQTEAQVGVSRAALRRAELQLERARADEERTEQLVQRGAATRQELERIRAQREDAEVQWDSARAQLAQVEANLELMELELARAHISAPVAGVVIQRPAVVGAHVGSNSVIATIAGIDPIEVAFHLPEREMGKLHEGQAIRVSVDAFPDRVFVGEVSRLGAAIETRTRTLPVWGRVPNPDLALRPGMFARVELVLEGKEDVLTVPREAILLSSGQEPFVYVVEDGRAVARPVVRGLEGSERVEIVEGLQEGDEVVVVGQHRLRPGRAVVVVTDEDLAFHERAAGTSGAGGRSR